MMNLRTLKLRTKEIVTNSSSADKENMYVIIYVYFKDYYSTHFTINYLILNFVINKHPGVCFV